MAKGERGHTYSHSPTHPSTNTHTRAQNAHHMFIKHYFLNFKQDLNIVRVVLTWTSDGLQRLIPYYNS